MIQKYRNEIAPIFYYGISKKTNEKDLKIPKLQPPDWNHPYWMTLYMTGGRTADKKYSGDILMYDSSQDKWTKTGELCRGRAYHAMSLVPIESDIEDECILDSDCFA